MMFSKENGNLTKIGSSKSNEFVVTDLLAELANVLSEKIKLESNYSTLKRECTELSQKLKTFKDIIYEERALLLNEYKKSQYELHSKDMCLMEKDMDAMKNQEKYLSEIKQLKETLEKLKQFSEEKESEVYCKIEKLSSELEESKTYNKRLLKELDKSCRKSKKYKSKLQQVICEMTRLQTGVKEQHNSTPLLDKACQANTDVRDLSEQSVQIVDECGDSGILSDLFFCTHPHDEDLNPLFIYKEM